MARTVFYWMKWLLWRVIIHGFHALWCVYFWKKGKRVPPIDNPLLLKSATCLAREIRERKVKSEEVVQAYRDRILEVEPYLNAVMEARFQDALKEARDVDLLVQSGNFTEQELVENKPFLGVPFTVKGIIKVEGMKSTAGSMLFRNMVADKDSMVVSLMKQAGGIVLALSNTPEFGVLYETSSILHGTTCNPYDTNKTPGGSSGGESALLGAGASLIGLGNDLCGSLRIAACFTGIFTHKGSQGLVPSLDCIPVVPVPTNEQVQAGPMCRYSEDLAPMMKVLTSRNKEKLNFGREADFKKLKIYYLDHIDEPMAANVDPDISQAMKKAILHFTTTYGTEAKELDLPKLNQSNQIVWHLLQDTEANIIKAMTLGKVEHLNVMLEMIKSLFGKSDFTLRFLFTYVFATCRLVFGRNDIPHYRKILHSLIDEFDHLLDENTVLLYPTFPKLAPYHAEITYALIPSTCNLGIFNYLGLPSTNVPFGLSQEGMPVGMQIIGAKNNDPLTIACAVELSRVFGGWIPPN